MKKFIDILKSLKFTSLLPVIFGLFLGWLIFGGSDEASHQHNGNSSGLSDAVIYTCSMHPQIRQDGPGKCPLCGMDLIPVSVDEQVEDDFSVKMSASARSIAEIQTSKVSRIPQSKQLSLNGKVRPDERLIQEVASRIGGRIESLRVNYTGQLVGKGSVLAEVYSPELISAQQELIYATKLKAKQPEIYSAAREKLLLWGFSERQLNAIESSGEVKNTMEILAPFGGTVTKREVSKGDYVKEGMPIVQLINLSKLWVVFDVYESDLFWLKKGQKVDFTVKSNPGKVYQSQISFIDPVVNPKTRVIGVRLEINNSDGSLKPEMLVQGIVNVSDAKAKNEIVIPKSAVLWTGDKAIVYVVDDQDESIFYYREIVLGPEVNDFFVVKTGLEEGESVASYGVFKIDAAAQLQGKKSMMSATKSKITTSNNEKQGNAESESFQAAYHRYMDAYFGLKQELVAGEVDKSNKSFTDLKKNLAELMKMEVSATTRLLLSEGETERSKALNAISASSNLKEMRSGLAELAAFTLKLTSQFNDAKNPIYYQFCPMAEGNKGAYWLSTVKEIRNPYFGEAMLTCGETIKQID